VVAYEQGIAYPVKVMVAEREEFKHLHRNKRGQVSTFDIK